MFGMTRSRRQTGPATLPAEHLEINQIRNLRIGESGWTVPWAMMVDENGRCYLNGRYKTHFLPGGTVQMQVHRTIKGIEVHIPKGEKYDTDRSIPWVGIQEDDLLPVHSIKTL